MPRTRSGPDAAVSDVMGTIMLLGITVSLVGVLALNLNSASSEAPPIVRIDMSAFGNANTIDLLHLGGTPVDLGDIQVVISSASVVKHRAVAGPDGTVWEMGEVLVVAPSTPLPSGPAEITLVNTVRGEVITTVSVNIGGGSAGGTPATFTISIELDGSSSPPTITAPSQVLAEATVAHSDGRKVVRQVYADLSGIDGPLWVALRDDGTRGDRVAADGIWSGILNVPMSAPRGTDTIKVNAVDLQGATAQAQATLNVL